MLTIWLMVVPAGGGGQRLCCVTNWVTVLERQMIPVLKDKCFCNEGEATSDQDIPHASGQPMSGLSAAQPFSPLKPSAHLPNCSARILLPSAFVNFPTVSVQ